MGTENSRLAVSLSVVRRLTRYLRHLEELENDGISRISSQVMANQLGLTASQIRQDLNSFGGFGQQGYGYSVEYLKSNIESILGINQKSRAILIGAGNLGRALLKNVDFSKCGVTLIGVCDCKESIIGTNVDGMVIMHIDKLSEIVKLSKPQMAILAIPPASVRKIAEQLVSLGVYGIWNFTNVDLRISDPKAIVEDVHFADSLITLRYRVGQQ